MHRGVVLYILISSIKFISGTFQCTNDGMFANPDDHHAFWHCAHGAGYLKHCPASLIWSQVQQNCIWNVPEPTITVTTTLLTTTETSTTMPMSSFLPPQCSNYTSITDGTRRTNNINLGAQSDNSYFSKTPTWVRFEGAAGTRLANYSVPSPRCGSEGAGWLKHPTEPTEPIQPVFNISSDSISCERIVFQLIPTW
ncbi:unnamed protein product [Rotaria sordida]|uniref:Chitin-binding type-2 domain-containing protein n=1 Tax=Rotaria sordida TaxID=392033 RepID=A0A814U2B8_9BILA|nr:unnamed protein product [Rotaria sordida]CAF1424307.1 unnamed protein product [Rotaria sordida]